MRVHHGHLQEKRHVRVHRGHLQAHDGHFDDDPQLLLRHQQNSARTLSTTTSSRTTTTATATTKELSTTTTTRTEAITAAESHRGWAWGHAAPLSGFDIKIVGPMDNVPTL